VASDTVKDSRQSKVFLAPMSAKLFWSILAFVVIVSGIYSVVRSPKQTDFQRTASITRQLRCLECEGLSVHDSDTQTSKSIAKDVARRVKKGESNSTIFAYYQNIYGEYIRLAPTNEKGNWLIYVLPAFGVLVLVAAIFLSITSRATKRMVAIFWMATGIIVLAGLIVFVKSAQSSKTPTATKSKKSTEQLLQQAVNESPTNGNLRALAIVQFAQDKNEDALRNFGKAAALDEHDGASRGYAAYIILTFGQSDVAREEADKAIAANSEDTTAIFFHGLVYYTIAQTDESVKTSYLQIANKDFDAVIEKSPDSDFAQQISDLRSQSFQDSLSTTIPR
jgi:cytochrome c-type biogenesis protein CcmH